MMHDYDIAIAGGGLNGAALALALAQGELRVCVIDARPAMLRAQPGFDGRAYALAATSQRMLRALGVWPDVAQYAQPIAQIKASDGRAGVGAAPLFLHFDSNELEEGPMGFILEERYLYAALLRALKAHTCITLIDQDALTDQTLNAKSGVVTLELASGKLVNAKVLVGCDGRQSGVAARAGIRRQGWDYGQTALVCAIRHDAPHEGIAHQFFMPSGPFALLPLPGGHHSSIVWSEQTDAAQAIAALNDSDYLAALRPRVGAFMGEISLAGTRFSYPLSFQLAERYSQARIALAGDAAHGVHPIAGQGLNIGLRDVAALAEVIIGAARRGEDIGAPDVLERYQRWRRFDAMALAFGIDQVNALFSNDSAVLRLGRALGMGAISSLPPLRRSLMRRAAGLSGALPRLLSGQSF